MSARRQAEARDLTGAAAPGGVPRALVVGRCIEVWADPSAEMPSFSAMRRHGVVRRWWFERAGLTETREQQELIPNDGPWSVDYLSSNGLEERVADRLAHAGCTVADLPRLREEALDLLAETEASR